MAKDEDCRQLADQCLMLANKRGSRQVRAILLRSRMVAWIGPPSSIYAPIRSPAEGSVQAQPRWGRRQRWPQFLWPWCAMRTKWPRPLGGWGGREERAGVCSGGRAVKYDKSFPASQNYTLAMEGAKQAP
jgi:hypothetical protein